MLAACTSSPSLQMVLALPVAVVLVFLSLVLFINWQLWHFPGPNCQSHVIYPMSSATVKAHRDELRRYETSKGTIRFQADHALPAALVRRLVKARIAESQTSRIGAKSHPRGKA